MSGDPEPMPTALQYAGETYTEKAKRKFQENPWVPLGAIATTAAFSMAAIRMRQGEAKSFNIWLRWRIIFQGITIAAVCAGTYSFGFRPDHNNVNLEIENDRRRREEKLARDRAEFEARVQAAMEEHEAESGFVKAVQEGRKAGGGSGTEPPRLGVSKAEKDKREKEVRRMIRDRETGSLARARSEQQSESTPASQPTEPPKSGSSKGWFGGWFGS